MREGEKALEDERQEKDSLKKDSTLDLDPSV